MNSERKLLEDLFDARLRKGAWKRGAQGLLFKGLEQSAPLLQRLFGGPLQSDGSRVATIDKLSSASLEDLFHHRVCGLRIPNFCSPSLAAQLSRWIREASGVRDWPVRNGDGTYTKSDTQYGVGLPVSEGFFSKEKFVRYFTDAVPAIHRLRSAAAPELSPIDRLRLELDEAWPKGAHVSHYQGRCMFVGIARVMRPETLLDSARADGICHVDDLPVASRSGGIFSVNVYLDVPAEGGELDIWNVSPSIWDFVSRYASFKHFGRAFHPESQRIVRALLPPPVRIKPQIGDAIVISTRRPHAVRGFTDGLRVTLQSFLAYRKDEPITLMC